LQKILVLTNTVDPHADSVINQLKDSNSVFRVNTDELLNNFSFDFINDDEDSIARLINPLKLSLNLDDISCIYYRRPEKPTSNLFTDIEKVLIEEAWHGLYHVLFSAYDKNWLGHPHRDKYASSRVVQLTHAKKVGWKTPPTLISRDPKKIRAFCQKYKDIAIKPLGEKGATLEQEWVPYFTSRVSAEQISIKSDAEISSTYNYLQQYIPKKNEWRITVIGEDVFPCIIHSQRTEESQTDWRKVHFDTVLHEKGAIPETFKKELIQYLKYLNLPFGAFDFILTPEDEFVFLECNPNGQWLWIEELTGLEISKSIAKWLEHN